MKFEVFMIDPPWKQLKSNKRRVRANQGKELDYPTLSLAAIFALLDQEIFTLAAEHHCVFLWTIDKYLSESEAAMTERGYIRHCRLIWDKTNGIAAAFTIRFSHEYLVWYYKPKLPLISNASRGIFRTVFAERSRQHSRKPDFAYRMVEQLYPAQQKIDVFSREKRLGWEQFGNQTNYFS
jgi:N6-adenosine-specific RNA methylase IME4